MAFVRRDVDEEVGEGGRSLLGECALGREEVSTRMSHVLVQRLSSECDKQVKRRYTEMANISGTDAEANRQSWRCPERVARIYASLFIA
jgi:hypothetical protein